MKIARELKVRYLWIDALCIIQNEDDHEDWKRECGKMARIYRNSYLTVAATWANSATGGCFITPDPGVVTGPIMMRKDGFVTLEGFLIPVSFEAQEIRAHCSELGSLRLEWFPDRIYDTEQMPATHLIPLVTGWSGSFSTFYGLVVKPFGQGTEMTRIGLATYPSKKIFSFPDCKKQVVTII
ncbi:hypothetical protein CEP52_009355 [Fusarium oligoseptatum]|uniref:Heterokaryon incompatibility domain-containing protein n=1 Tax=Fusarium oligoseptatum TaxID=2604345 RepID=A0A428TDF1_9HYPO|nr:hypothetical protein CEP52_009355 [Fusarium oligoseptatum]